MPAETHALAHHAPRTLLAGRRKWRMPPVYHRDSGACYRRHQVKHFTERGAAPRPDVDHGHLRIPGRSGHRCRDRVADIGEVPPLPAVPHSGTPRPDMAASKIRLIAISGRCRGP